MTEIPKEYQLKCEGCGKILDMRDVNIISHGWIEDGMIVCYLDEGEHSIPYSGSQMIGEPIFWTKDKESININ